MSRPHSTTQGGPSTTCTPLIPLRSTSTGSRPPKYLDHEVCHSFGPLIPRETRLRFSDFLNFWSGPLTVPHSSWTHVRVVWSLPREDLLLRPQSLLRSRTTPHFYLWVRGSPYSSFPSTRDTHLVPIPGVNPISETWGTRDRGPRTPSTATRLGASWLGVERTTGGRVLVTVSEVWSQVVTLLPDTPR